jgi:F-box and WD-40 domain protein 1/11
VTSSELKKARNTIQNLRALLVSFTSDFQIKSAEFQPFLDFIHQNCEDDKRLADLEDTFKRSLTNLYTSCPYNLSIFQIPSDLIFMVMEFLGVRELTVFSYTCKEIYSMCQAQKLWKNLGFSRWKEDNFDRRRFLKRYSQEMMWFHTRPAVSTLIGHHGSVTCLDFLEGSQVFVSGSDDCSLSLWEVKTINPDKGMLKQHHIQTRPINKKICFYGHGGPVWTCCFSPSNTLISGSHDKTLKVWNMSTGQCQFTMRGHNGWISSIDSTSSLIISSAWDSTVKFWNIETKNQVQNLHFEDIVYCLKAKNQTLALGTKSHSLEVWDILRTSQVLNCVGHLKAVNALKMTENLIVSGSSDSLVKVWDVRTGECVGNLPGHSNKVVCVDFEEGPMRVVSGGYDKSIRVWDLRNFCTARSVLRGHSEPVFCVRFDQTKLVSGSMDQCIKIWNFESS